MKMQLPMKILPPLAYSTAEIHMLLGLMLSGIRFIQQTTEKALAKLPTDLYSLLIRTVPPDLPRNHRITEQIRLERTFETIGSNLVNHTIALSATPSLFLNTFRGGTPETVIPPLPRAVYSNAQSLFS